MAIQSLLGDPDRKTSPTTQPVVQYNLEEDTGEEEGTVISSPNVLTNQLLFEQLRRQEPNYDWQWRRSHTENDDHFDFIQFPKVKEPIR